MCGRYTLFTDKEYWDIRNIVKEVQQQIAQSDSRAAALKTGDIYPTNLAPILIQNEQLLKPVAAIWGFRNYHNGGVIINARSETAKEKPMFKKALSSSRCVVPTTGFYEWDGEKKKYLFRLLEGGAVYLAGLMQSFGGERRFTILTTASNASVSPVHDRMPVIIPKEKIEDWLFNPNMVLRIMAEVQPELDVVLCG